MPDKGTILASVWRNCRKPLKTSPRIAGVVIEIRSGHLLNLSLEYYCYTNLVSKKVMFQLIRTFRNFSPK